MIEIIVLWQANENRALLKHPWAVTPRLWFLISLLFLLGRSLLVGNKIFTRRGEGFLFAFSVSCKAFLKSGSAGAAGAKT